MLAGKAPLTATRNVNRRLQTETSAAVQSVGSVVWAGRLADGNVPEPVNATVGAGPDAAGGRSEHDALHQQLQDRVQILEAQLAVKSGQGMVAFTLRGPCARAMGYVWVPQSALRVWCVPLVV